MVSVGESLRGTAVFFALCMAGVSKKNRENQRSGLGAISRHLGGVSGPIWGLGADLA